MSRRPNLINTHEDDQREITKSAWRIATRRECEPILIMANLAGIRRNTALGLQIRPRSTELRGQLAPFLSGFDQNAPLILVGRALDCLLDREPACLMNLPIVLGDITTHMG